MRKLSAAGGALAWYLLAAWLGGATEAADASPTVGGTMQAREPASSAPAHTNRLRDATSPYLLQHQHNPVDWYPWGPEALARAKAEDKPIFLSIGYAACHWCHVMAHESFEDAQTAETLNKLFINIKVDREERPDLDEIYMQATLVLNQGNGGWPMSVWLTPDLKPFFAGTYFPPERRYGRPGFRELCEMIGKTWRERRTELLQHADELTGAVQRMLQAAPTDGTELSLALVDETAEQLAAAFDKTSGGLTGGGTNKFPPSMALDLLMRSAHRRAAESARRKQFIELVALTLDHMAAGGIYDQLGGGIHRYSTDVEWHVPHFEKMLYDQALVCRSYLDAFQVTGKADYARVAREICDYVLTDLRCASGAFLSSRDADSEGVEGKFYVWTKAQVLDVLGEDCGEKFCAVYDISASGNWADPHDPDGCKSIPRRLRDEETCARMFNVPVAEFRQKLANCREKLVVARGQRSAPGLDDKVLCEWNGLMIASLARAGTVLSEPRYVQAAEAAARSILTRQYRDGRLRRAYRAGRTTGTAFLSDYANMIEACVELYEATFDRKWLTQAVALQKTALELFWDERGGGFYFTPDDHEQLIARSKDVRDNAVPSGNSVMLTNLLRLALYTGDATLKDRATRHMAALAGDVQRSPWASERFLAGVDFAYAQPVEIAIVGDPSQPATQALLCVVRESYLPNRVLMLHNPQRPDDSFKSPLLANRGLVAGRPAAYVCRNFVCQTPVTAPAELRAQLTR